MLLLWSPVSKPKIYSDAEGEWHVILMCFYNVYTEIYPVHTVGTVEHVIYLPGCRAGRWKPMLGL